jgi:hypothetical protein
MEPTCHASTFNFHQPKPHGTFKLFVHSGLDGPIAAFELAILPPGLSCPIGQQTSRTHLLWQKQLIACEHHQHIAHLPMITPAQRAIKLGLIVINFA